SLIGTIQRILVERPSRRSAQMAGRTSTNRMVNFDGPATLVGEFVDVAITAALNNSLQGQLLETAVSA
ncbi:MAG: TRAM domain-containing protein, partial [Pseudomonadota bacterium]|nr:TRAM domain-containing protein [Pseudomonadota bacterium]